MATDVKAMSFSDHSKLIQFLDNQNINSSNIIAIVSGDGVTVFYTPASDTSPPLFEIHEPPLSNVHVADPVEIYLRAVDISAQPPTAAAKRPMDPEWTNLAVVNVSPGLWKVVFPTQMIRPPQVDYFITAQDADGNRWYFGTAGTPKYFIVNT